jgi:hypothetical protein
MATPVPGTHPTPTAPAAAKPVAEKKEPKAPKPKKEGTTAPRPRLPKFADEHLITVLQEGAKARNAHTRFLEYKTGMTVKAYVDLIREKYSRTDGQTHADLRWDADHKFIHVGPTVVPVPVAAPASAPATPAAA